MDKGPEAQRISRMYSTEPYDIAISVETGHTAWPNT